MKKFINRHTIITAKLIITGFLVQGCIIEEFEQVFIPFTDEETVLTGQIIGESVSENQNGLLSTFSEAFAIPTQSNLVRGPSPLSTGTFRNLDNYAYNFDPGTGIHQVTFSKRIENQEFTSLSNYTLHYIFYDRNQNILDDPNQQRNEIDAVDFSATRSGDIQSGTKNSYFKRTDRLFIDGLLSTSGILSIDGYHSGDGVFIRIDSGGRRFDREYLLEMNFLDIRINKSVVETNRNYRKGVTGALCYESTIKQIRNGSPETKIVNGTLEFNGDGTALLRFTESLDIFRLKLQSGEVLDDDEFEGRVIRVNLSDNIFTIANGQRIQIDEHTKIDDGDFLTLEEVAVAVDNDVRIIAEGDYFHPDKNVNLWIATEVEFELESNEFEDIVVSVDLIENSFMLVNGDRYFITEKSEVEFNDGLESLADVADAVDTGLPVEADGKYIIDPATGKQVVTEVEFELEFDEFEEYVVSVNLPGSFFTLESGKNVKVTEDTIIDDDGDYLTLEEVAEALDGGRQVEAEGKFYYDYTSGFWIAVEVEFKS